MKRKHETPTRVKEGPTPGRMVWRKSPYLSVHRDTTDAEVRAAELAGVVVADADGYLYVVPTVLGRPGDPERVPYHPDEFYDSPRAAAEAAAEENEREGKDLLEGADRLREYVALHDGRPQAPDEPAPRETSAA